MTRTASGIQTLLVIILAGAMMTGCSKNYEAEREYWRAEQLLKSITPAEVQTKGGQILDPLVTAFQVIAEKYPSTPRALDSIFAIAKLQTGQKNFEAARETYRKVIGTYGNHQEKVVEARQNIAALYEHEGKWTEAERELWDLAENHPLSQQGAYAPVHIIVHYVKTKDEKAKSDAYSRAKDYYDRMLKEVGPIQAQSGLKNYYALLELSYGQWEQARNIWLSIPEEFPDSPYSPLAFLSAAEISWKRGDLKTAESAYLKFIEKYPKHTLMVKAQSQLGILHLNQKEYNLARDFFKRALELVKGDPSSSTEVQLLIAKSYEAENKWPEAEAIYLELQTNYPESRVGLQIPLLLAEHSEKSGDKATAEKIRAEALEKYMALEAKLQDPELVDYVRRLQNTVYAQNEDWPKVLDNFDKNFEREKSTTKKGSWLFLKALVTENRIKDKSSAISLYANFLQKFPEHPLSRLAKQRHDQLLNPAPQA